MVLPCVVEGKVIILNNNNTGLEEQGRPRDSTKIEGRESR